MFNHVLTRRFRASKVPAVGVGFWIVKLLTTAMGEAHQIFSSTALLPSPS